MPIEKYDLDMVLANREDYVVVWQECFGEIPDVEEYRQNIDSVLEVGRQAALSHNLNRSEKQLLHEHLKMFHAWIEEK